jgi:small subunit ribosomal protein S16
MVKIRLKRMGATKRPFYRVVVADARSPRDGRFIEAIGKYHPLDDPSVIEIDSERALHWLTVGAQPSQQVESLLKVTGVWAEFEAARPSTKEKAAVKAKNDAKKLARGEAVAKEAAKAAAKAEKAAAKKAQAEAKAKVSEPAPVPAAAPPETPTAPEPAAAAPAEEAAAEGPAADAPSDEPESS